MTFTVMPVWVLGEEFAHLPVAPILGGILGVRSVGLAILEHDDEVVLRLVGVHLVDVRADEARDLGSS